jgi:phosphoserine phosphatase
MQLTYEVQENLGDRAYWRWHDEHGIELVVLSGTAHFTIASKTQGTSAAALADAVKFAREVLAKCG